MSVIRKKPYVEKVVESLSSESLELLRETLNTNKENVNCSLIGGNNLLKRFRKISGSIKLNYYLEDNDSQRFNNYINLKFLSTYEELKSFIQSRTGFDFENNALKIWTATDTETSSDIRSFNIVIEDNNKSIVFEDEEGSRVGTTVFLGQEPASGTGYNGEGWYSIDLDTLALTKNNDNFLTVVSSFASLSYNIEVLIVPSELDQFISLEEPFKLNTELQGHIPAVGDKIEKVYFNPNAYSTDEEWKLWYESLKKEYSELDSEWDCNVLYFKLANQDVNHDGISNHYPLEGVGDLTDIFAFSVLYNACLYVSNDALTGTYSAVYAQFGITESGWYLVNLSNNLVQKITDIKELTSEYMPVTVVEDGWACFDLNNHLFAKVVSYNTPFVETPIQNNLKPAVASVGEEIKKIYINLGYFNNDLNKMMEYGDGSKLVLFKYNDGTTVREFYYIQSIFYIGDTGTNKIVAYVNQKKAIDLSLSQDYVNKWVLFEETEPDVFNVLEVIDTDVYELPLEGTITELGDTSLISFNKPFTEISGYIYDEITPVNLQLESNNLKTGILVWNDEYCTLLAYHRFEDMREYEIDYEKYSFKAINESLTINELRRVVFTPTQEDTALNINSLSLEEDEVMFDKVFKSSDLVYNGKVLFVEDNVKLFDINSVYKAQVEIASELQTAYAKPINEREIEFRAAMPEENGDIGEIKLWVELPSNLSHYVLSSLFTMNTLSASDASVQAQVINFFKFAMDSEEATLPIKLTKMKYVSK